MLMGLAAGCTHAKDRPAAAPATAVAVARPVVPVAAPDPEPAPHLPSPTLAGWSMQFDAPALKAPDGKVALVTALAVPLYAAPDAKRVIGYSGIGSTLPAKPARGRGCSEGWLAVSGGAYLCAGDGAKLIDPPQRDRVLGALGRARAPMLSRPNPYVYGKARKGAFLLARPPRNSELSGLTAGKPARALDAQALNGTYLLSVVGKQEPGAGGPYVRTFRGRYLPAADFKRFPDAPMHGEHLGKRVKLPLAFTYRPTQVYCLGGESGGACGIADKHARFPAGATVERDRRELVMVGENLAVPRVDVRIARRVEKPAAVPEAERWIHIDLSEQTLVAYQGNKPVYATLVSSGRPGHDTPTGLFDVTRKYLTKVMNGHDDEGPYSVQEVPWTMYFHGNYAVHGAYWHDVFGHTRSHGCVNVPPVDARWLFYWSRPHLPAGWTAMLAAHGMHVYVTGKTPPEEEGT